MNVGTNHSDEESDNYTVNCNVTSTAAPEFDSTPAGGSTINLVGSVGGGGNTSMITVSNLGTANLTVTPSGLGGILSIAPNSLQNIGASGNQAFTITYNRSAS